MACATREGSGPSDSPLWKLGANKEKAREKARSEAEGTDFREEGGAAMAAGVEEIRRRVKRRMWEDRCAGICVRWWCGWGKCGKGWGEGREGKWRGWKGREVEGMEGKGKERKRIGVLNKC